MTMFVLFLNPLSSKCPHFSHLLTVIWCNNFAYLYFQNKNNKKTTNNNAVTKQNENNHTHPSNNKAANPFSLPYILSNIPILVTDMAILETDTKQAVSCSCFVWFRAIQAQWISNYVLYVLVVICYTVILNIFWQCTHFWYLLQPTKTAKISNYLNLVCEF